MAEVYRAHDKRLIRDVAYPALPETPPPIPIGCGVLSRKLVPLPR